MKFSKFKTAKLSKSTLSTIKGGSYACTILCSREHVFGGSAYKACYSGCIKEKV